MNVCEGCISPVSQNTNLKGITYLETAKGHIFMLMQISYPYIFWNNVTKFQENCASSFWDMRKSMRVIVVVEYQGGGAHKLDRYPFRKKWEDHKNNTHTKIKFYIIFIKFFFFLWWILKVLQIRGGWRDSMHRALSVEKNEKITRTGPLSGHTKIKFYIIFIDFFFLW